MNDDETAVVQAAGDEEGEESDLESFEITDEVQLSDSDIDLKFEDEW